MRLTNDLKKYCKQTSTTCTIIAMHEQVIISFNLCLETVHRKCQAQQFRK